MLEAQDSSSQRRWVLIDAKSLGRAFRRRRFELFLSLVDAVLAQKADSRIVDLGGTPDYWMQVGDLLGPRRYPVTLVNRTIFPAPGARFASVAGDARHVPIFADMSFDLVHSNSVIEHVGRWADMEAMAGEARRLAPAYFVQTPYFWFPVEPHCRTAFFHWLPESIRVSMLMRKSRGHWRQAEDIASAMRQIQSATLLDRRMFATLFPDAKIHRERVFGFTKSLVAIRGSPASDGS